MQFFAMFTRALPAILVTATSLAHGQGVEVGFAEEFALAVDREQALEQLIPGTRDYYYYHCLQAQHTGQLDEVEPLLRQWRDRHGSDSRMIQVENRQVLLEYEDHPGESLEDLRGRLGVKLDHVREVRGASAGVPTRLDPEWISRSRLSEEARRRHKNSVQGFREPAYEFLLASDLDRLTLRDLLGRLRRPDYHNLPALVVRDLRAPDSGSFGSRHVHELLLLDQLEECVQLEPKLLNDPKFIDVYLRRLAPSADVDWRRDASAREAYLDRLWGFARRLDPAHSSLKAHVLYHRLAHDRTRGVHDKDRFLAYLRLPRPSAHVHPDYLRGQARRSETADFSRQFPTQLPVVGSDDDLVCDYLGHFFETESSYQPYADLVRADYLRRLFAETKLLSGAGEEERWSSMLADPSYYQQLRERVELEFAPTQPSEYAALDDVAIDLDLKNVQTLIVKVFEINTLNYYRDQQKEVDPSIPLDGLIANWETTETYSDSPLHRVRRRFEFPQLRKAGVFVVEFIGNGLSSRAVIHKGKLQYHERMGSAGHVLRVSDEAGRPLEGASVWIGGHQYSSDADGDVVIPYSQEAGYQNIILRHGDRASLDRIKIAGEKVELSASVYVDREALLSRRKARLLVRPTLRINGRPASLKLLEDPRLEIQSTDANGVEATQDVRDLALSDRSELVHELLVPENLSSLDVRLAGQVLNLTTGERSAVTSSSSRFACSAIDETGATVAGLLSRTEVGYVLDLLGKNGEPSVDHPVQMELRHREFEQEVRVRLKTDEHGRVHLGELTDITAVQVKGLQDGFNVWNLQDAKRSYARRWHGRSGEVLRIPWQGAAPTEVRSAVSLLEVRGGAFVHDRVGNARIRDGYLELSGLAAGDYELLLKRSGRKFDVQVTAGERRDGWVFGEHRQLQSRDDAPLHITGVAADASRLRVELAHADVDARVHVVATRYLPAYDPYSSLVAPSPAELDRRLVEPATSQYHAGREIGDEYRYILERRFAKKFPGNMLERPALLLNPWAVDDASRQFNDVIGAGGGAGGGFGGRYGRRGAGKAGGRGDWSSKAPGIYPNLEFLSQPAVILSNLQPDESGVVEVPLADLGGGHLVHVVALDSRETVYATHVLADRPLEPRDRRLSNTLDPDRHFSEQREIRLIEPGGRAVLEDLASSRAEVYDSLAAVHQLLLTLSGSEDLREFSFVLQWPELNDTEKRDLYSRYACHELHFFLAQKDPAFFREVVAPYLANKMHKTFLDQWLLGEDLSGYLTPWRYSRLNIVERILLARRVDGEGAATQRHVRDLAKLLPVSAEETRRLFETALRGNALASEERLRGLSDLQLSLAEGKVNSGRRADAAGRAVRFRGGADAAEPADGVAFAAPMEGVPNNAPVDKFVEEVEALEELGYVAGGEKLKKSKREQAKNKDVDRRALVRRRYRSPAATRRWVERNYWRLPIDFHDADLVAVNSFWRDFALRPDGQPFVSANVAEVAGTFAEMMFALSVLDLPFVAGEYETSFADASMTIEAETPLLLVRRELRETEAPADRASILVSQNFFRRDDRHRVVDGQAIEKYVTGEFLRGEVYGGHIVLTNPTAARHRLELTVQIPAGAIPVQQGFYTRGFTIDLGAYSTATQEYYFYFPEPGEFRGFPVHIARRGELLGFAQPATMTVVEQLSSEDTTSWAYLSQNGDAGAVIDYLQAANLHDTDLGRIAWRMSDREFFVQVTDLLRSQHAYDSSLWGYGFLHDDVGAIRDYLEMEGSYLAQCGAVVECSLANVDPVERRSYQHVEYRPLVHRRAHQLGRLPTILNADLGAQYGRLLSVFAHRKQLDAIDWMSATYYLLLQDRVDAALETFARVDPSGLPTRIQYDYFRAYLDFFSDDHRIARGIAESYADHPVTEWRERFADVIAQLDEAEGVVSHVAQADDPKLDELAATEPALELDVESSQLVIHHENVDGCEVRFYEMDIELLFSTNPFVQQGAGSFSYIKPNRVDRISLSGKRSETRVELPQEFLAANVLVEIRAGGLVRRRASYANTMTVQMIENYGQLKVTDAATGRPLPKVYVKVYSRNGGGAAQFYKDGYTDLRGRFDYASVSGDAGSVDRFAILVSSEESGSVIRDAAPPLQ